MRVRPQRLQLRHARADRRLTNDPPSEKLNASALLERHDPSVAFPKLIREGLAKLRKIGSDQCRYEKDFCVLAGIAHNHIGRFRAQFDKHIVLVPGRDGRPKCAWFADAKVAGRVREQLRKSIPNYDDES